MKKVLFILGLIFLSAGTAWTKVSLKPDVSLKPIGYVNDFAGILTEADKTRIETLITETKKKTSAEIAVVTINSLEGANLEEFANEIFNTWGIGKKGKDNGALILVAKNERKIRIETGYGLEPILPDGKCGEIIRNVLTPAFRKGEFGEGLYQATTLISQVISGENVTIPAGESSTEKIPVFFLLFWIGFCLLGIIGSMVNPHRLKRIKKRYGRAWQEHWYWWYGSVSSGSGGGGGFGSGGGGFGGGGGGGGGASGGW